MQSDSSELSLNSFIKSLGFDKFSPNLIECAFTHSSYTKENNLPYDACYERLEFLGDAVLKMATTDYLYEKYPDKSEGDLTKIRSIVVSDEILHKVALSLNIEPFIRVSSAQHKCNGQSLESIQACVMEALFGALYLSSDRGKLNDFITSQLAPIIDEILSNKTVYNAKALLQEFTQKNSNELPKYELIEQTGAAHDRTFTVAVYYKNDCLGKASAKTKKAAQQEAAYKACQKLELINQKGF